MKIAKSSAMILTAFCFAVFASPAFGCLCEPEPKFVEALTQATAVFSGELVSAKYEKGFLDEFHQQTLAGFQEMDKNWRADAIEVFVFRFKVQNLWKGDVANEAILVNSQMRRDDGATIIGDCDYDFEVGEKYLIYANATNGVMRTSGCSRTNLLRKVKKDLKLLDRNTKQNYSTTNL